MPPNGNEGNVPVYGYLYNWAAVMNGEGSSSANPSGVQGICPVGWHVPFKLEWGQQLYDYVRSQSQYQCGGSSDNIAKALASTTGWHGDDNPCTVGNNPSSNNATGFSAVPAGNYDHGSYEAPGNNAYLISSTWKVIKRGNRKARRTAGFPEKNATFAVSKKNANGTYK